MWTRLRREIQQIGFLTPLEIEHVILCKGYEDISSISAYLMEEGYEENEINRCITYCLECEILTTNNGKVRIKASRFNLARRIMIIDVVANNGSRIETREERKRSILIPGYGPRFGLNKADVTKILEGLLFFKYESISDFQDDIDWLLDEKAIEHLLN